MGKTIEKVKLWNILDEEKIKKGEISPIEVEAQIDNGATTAAVLPKTIAETLRLPVTRQTWVKYANEKKERKDVVRGLRVEIMGRDVTCDAVVEPDRETVLIGQFALEILDLWIDSKNGRLIPNPESPDAPMLEIL
jgi:clan AA aspartic protease